MSGTDRPSRIVRLANFVGPRSGGLRTALYELGRGYRAAGHDPVLIVPGPSYSDVDSPQGRVITLPGPAVPGMGGYRVVLGRRRLGALLVELRPDRIEVSDRTTLRWTGSWARRNGVRSVMVSHENATALLSMASPDWLPARGLADRLNRATAARYDTIVATTEFAAAEFRRIGAAALVKVPLGVDLERFTPSLRDPELRRSLAGRHELLLVHCGRLSPEKHVERSVEAVAALRARGVPAVLVIVGDGPRRPALERQARGLPVRFLGFVPDRGLVARLLATADAVLAPGPAETFGLAALEAMACGTPVVAAGDGALGEVIGDAGVAVPPAIGRGGFRGRAARRAVPSVRSALPSARRAAGDAVDPLPARSEAGERFAQAVLELYARPEPDRRAAARSRAQVFDWPAAVGGMLAAHGLDPLRTFEEVGSWPGAEFPAESAPASQAALAPAAGPLVRPR